jgi:hypothetical protein
MIRKDLDQVHLQWKNILQPLKIIIIDIIIAYYTYKHYHLNPLVQNKLKFFIKKTIPYGFIFVCTQFYKQIPLKLLFQSIFTIVVLHQKYGKLKMYSN